MSTASFAQSKFHLRAIKGRRAKNPPREILCTRDDALFFRNQTRAIVRHFFEISCQVGRLPSILGREFFRAKVSHHGIPSFEEQAVFVHDVERALARLSPQHLEVISLVGMHHYTLEEVAILLGFCRSTVIGHYAGAIDTLAQIFLTSGLLRESRPDRHLRRFEAEEPEPDVGEMPPKKPVASVSAEPLYPVTEVGKRYSFVEQQGTA